MFTKKYIYFIAAASLLSTGCKNESAVDDSQDFPFTATFGDQAGENTLKTTLVKNGLNSEGRDKFFGSWNLSDTMLISDGAIASKYYSNAEGAVKATLKRCEGEERISFEPGTSYLAYYPGEKATWDGANGFNVVLPDTQVFNPNGTVTDDAYPMISKSASISLPFYNLCSVLRVFVSCPVPCKIEKIDVNSDEFNLSGPAYATFVDDVPTLTMSTEKNPVTNKYRTVTLSCGTDGVEVGPTPKEFYIVLPAGTYTAKKFNYVIYTKGGGGTRTTITSDLTLERSKVSTDSKVRPVYVGEGNEGNPGDNAE